MRSLRQLVTSLLFGALSMVIVLGGVSLSLAEGNIPSLTTSPTFPTPNQPLAITLTPATSEGAIETSPTPTLTLPLLESETPTATLTPAPSTNCPPPNGWHAITVGNDDTLTSLASAYDTTAEQLTQQNCLLTANVEAGMMLYVPNVTQATTAPCSPPAGWTVYIVQAGDSLYHISWSYGLTVQELQQANCRGTSYLIHTGEKLYVPRVATRTPPDTFFPTNTFYPTETEPVPSDTPPLLPTSSVTETKIPPSATSESPTNTNTP
jgi:LysM repeat protein